MEEVNKKKILVVDDEPGVRLLVRKMLSNNYAVFEAQDGEEAVNTARNEKPDVILMDIMMPRMDGLMACYTIKTNLATKEIPIIMLTAVGYDLDKKLSQDVMGADGYITKPFTREALLESIRQFSANTPKHSPQR